MGKGRMVHQEQQQINRTGGREKREDHVWTEGEKRRAIVCLSLVFRVMLLYSSCCLLFVFVGCLVVDHRSYIADGAGLSIYQQQQQRRRQQQQQHSSDH